MIMSYNIYVIIFYLLQERVTELARLLEVRKVGWIFAHPPREEK